VKTGSLVAGGVEGNVKINRSDVGTDNMRSEVGR
jgi:hypothetical protein